MWLIWIIVLLLSTILPSITTIPVVFVVLLCLFVVMRKSWILPLALVAGLLMDFSSLNLVGKTSLFFIISLFLVLLYERKFEVKTLPFVAISSFVGSAGYLVLFGYDHLIQQSLVSAILAVLIFKFLISNLKLW